MSHTRGNLPADAMHELKHLCGPQYEVRIGVRGGERAQTSALKKLHGRSKYVPHQGAREKARRLKQEAR